MSQVTAAFSDVDVPHVYINKYIHSYQRPGEKSESVSSANYLLTSKTVGSCSST